MTIGEAREGFPLAGWHELSRAILHGPVLKNEQCSRLASRTPRMIGRSEAKRVLKVVERHIVLKYWSGIDCNYVRLRTKLGVSS